MDLIIISGFLGSGKTSLLLALARHFTQVQHRKVAIIENEVGKVGVDDLALQGEGLPVREIYSGCICCTLRGDLVRTLLELERTWAPDLVFLEPSGVAAPAQVEEAFIGYGGEIRSKQLLVLFDAGRFSAIKALSLPFVENGIRAANLVLLTKIDQATPAETEGFAGEIRRIRPDVPLLPISVQAGTNLDRLLAWFAESAAGVCQTVPSESEKASAANPDPAASLADAAVHAVEETLRFPLPLDRTQLLPHLSGFLKELAADLKARGCTMIGHLKAIVRGRKTGYLLVSLTEFGAEPDVRGALPGQHPEVILRLNAIVFGIDRLTLAWRAGEHLIRFREKLKTAGE